MGETRLSSYDGRMLRESFALLAFALAAPVAAEPAEAPKLDLSVKATGCAAASADEVVVCGKKDERYRLDSAVMAVERSKEPSSGSRPPEYLSVNLQSCLPHGNGGWRGTRCRPGAQDRRGRRPGCGARDPGRGLAGAASNRPAGLSSLPGVQGASRGATAKRQAGVWSPAESGHQRPLTRR